MVVLWVVVGLVEVDLVEWKIEIVEDAVPHQHVIAPSGALKFPCLRRRERPEITMTTVQGRKGKPTTLAPVPRDTPKTGVREPSSAVVVGQRFISVTVSNIQVVLPP